MGSIIICKYMMANEPYIIEKENLNIYSTEELCFYLIHHIYDIDTTVINGRLADWLEFEIGAVRIAGVLRQQIAGKTPVIKMIEMLLVDLDYSTKDEIQQIVYKQTLPVTPAREAENLGNLFMQQDKYEKAIKAFRKNLRYRKQEREDEIGEALVYEKIAICYARLFMYNEAAESFALSYMKNPLPQTIDLYRATIEMGGEEVSGMENIGYESTKVYYSQKSSLEQKIIEDTYKDIIEKVSNIQELKNQEKENAYREALDALILELVDASKKQLS